MRVITGLERSRNGATNLLTMESGMREYLDESGTHGLSAVQTPITCHYSQLLVV